MLNKIFEPLKIGNLELKNRLVVPPMVVNFCTPDGMVTERFIKHHEAKAKGGWGLITIEQSVISKQGKGHPGQPGLWSDDHIEGLKALTDRVHAAGGRISVQINHAGRQTMSFLTGEQPVAPSAIKDPLMPETPRELSIDEIQNIVKQFGAAALRAKKAGFDMIEEHAHAGYLIASFLSPMSNKRTDEYGGPLLNRIRFALEVLKEMRENVGADFPIMFRFSADELVDGGLSLGDTIAIAQLVEEAGVNALDVSVGNSNSFVYMVQPTAVAHGFVADIAQQIKNAVSIPVAVAGRINDPFVAEAILRSGKADLVSMGRSSIADPELPNKAREGRFDEIQYCIACMQGCGNVGRYTPLECLVNTMAGREEEYAIKEAEIKKKVFVIGGGVAGMQASIVAARRGHEVSIFEKEAKLGGQWVLAGVPPKKTECNTITVWQKNQLNKLGVKIHLNTEASEGMILKENPDVVVVATGAEPIMPNIKGVEHKTVVQAFDVFASKVDVGNRVVVIGGGLVGSEMADHLAVHRKSVVLIEMLDAISKDGTYNTNYFLFKSLKENGVEIITNAKVKEIKENAVIYEKDGKDFEIEKVDNTVLAIGAKSVNGLFNKLADVAKEVVVIGDAKQARNALDAIKEGYEAGLSI